LNEGFKMNKLLIFCILIIGITSISGCIGGHGTIHIQEIEDIGNGTYFEITDDELKEYPELIRSISGEGCTKHDSGGWDCELSSDEINRILDLITQKKVEQDYPFEMWVRTTAWEIDEIPTPTPAYIEITIEDMERFPKIKKAVVEPDRWHGISLNEWGNFQEFTQGYHDQNGEWIKFRDQLYQIGDTENIRSYIRNTESYINVEGEYYTFRVRPVG